MGQLREQLKKTLSAELPNMQSQLRPVKQILDQYGNAFTTGSQKAQAAIKQTGDKAKQTAQATQQAADTVKKALSTASDPLKNINAQIKADSVGAAAQQAKQGAEAEKTALEAVAKQHEHIAETVEKQMQAEREERAAEESAVDINASPGYPKTKFKTAGEIYAEQQGASAPNTPMVDTSALTGWQRFTARYYAILDNVKAKLFQLGIYGKENVQKVASATDKATSATKKWGNQAESSTNKATSGFSRTNSMIGRMIIRMAVWKLISTAIDAAKTGINDMAQGVSSANVTMSQLATSVLYLKNSIGAALMPAINAIAPAITWITDKIAGLFNMIGMLNARIFGGVTTITVAKRANVDYAATLGKTGDSAEKAAEKQKKAAEKAQKAAEKAKEAQEKANESVLSFDKLNKLDAPAKPETSDDDSSSTTPTSDAGAGMPSYGSMFTTQKIPARISALGDKIKAELAKWAQYAQPTIAAFQRLVKSLEPLKTFVARGAEDFYNDFLVPVGKWTLGKGLPEFFDITSALIKSINWKVLNKALDDLWKALTPFAIHVGEGLLWFCQYVICPIIKWAANDLAPAALKLLANAIKAVDSATQALKPLGTWLYNNFLRPLGQWTGGVVVGAIRGVGNALGQISNWIDHNQETFRGMVITIGAFFAAWKVTELLAFIEESGGVVGALKAMTTALFGATAAKLADKVQTIQLTFMYAGDFVKGIAKGTAALAKQIVQWVALKAAKIADAVQTAAQTAATKLATVAQTALNFVLNANPIALVIIAISGLVAAIVVLWNKNAAFRDFILGVWKALQDAAGKVGHWFQNDFVGFFKNALKWIQNTWNGAGDWFKGIFDKIKGAFKPNMISDKMGQAWQWVKDRWSGAGKWFGDIWQSIISKFKPNMISDGFKKAWNALTSWKIPTPHIWWGSNGYQTSGWMYDALNALHLPTRLPSLDVEWYAKGGVFDAQSVIGVGEYAGAQGNPEIVTPQKIMYDTVVEANGELVSAVSSLAYQIIKAINDNDGDTVLNIDGEKVGKVVVSHINNTIRRTGKSPLLA